MSIEASLLLDIIVVPAAIAGVVLLAAWRPWKVAVENGHWGGAVAIGVAYAVGHVLNVDRVPGFPPVQVIDWLVYFAIGAALVGLIPAFVRLSWWAMLPLCALVCVTLAWLIVRELPEASRAWEAPWIGVLVIGACGLGAGLATWSYDLLCERHTGGAAPIALWIAIAGSSYLFLENGAAKAMHLSGVVAATCAVAAIIGWWRPTSSLARGGIVVAMPLVAGLWLVTVLFGHDVNPWVAILAFLSPQAAWAGDLPAVRGLKSWQRALVRVCSVGLFIGLVVAFGRPPPDPLGDLYEGY